MKETKPKFRKHIFWDVDYNKIDYKKYPRFVIRKVVQWGNFSDWKELNSFYSTEKIISEVKKICNFDDKDRNFLHIFYNIPLNQLCNTRQLARKFSPFYQRLVK